VYEGTVANLPVRVTLVFNVKTPIFRGSYYYPTHRPGASLPEGINYISQIIMLREYSNGKVTANIQLCFDVKQGIKKLTGTMANVDGKSFNVKLLLLSTH